MVGHRGRGTGGLTRVVVSSPPSSQATRQDPVESSSELSGHKAVEHGVYSTKSKSYCLVSCRLSHEPVDVNTSFGKHKEPEIHILWES